MKLLLSLLILCSLNAGAQETNTAKFLQEHPEFTKTTRMALGDVATIGTVIRINPADTAASSVVRKRDTVRVLMLLCDTLLYASSTMGYISEEAQAMNDGRAVFWDFGYSVREIHNEQEGRIDWYFDHQREPRDYGVHLYYLNSRKQPLAKNIIVWQSMAVK